MLEYEREVAAERRVERSVEHLTALYLYSVEAPILSETHGYRIQNDDFTAIRCAAKLSLDVSF